MMSFDAIAIFLEGSLPMSNLQFTLALLIFLLLAVHAGWSAQTSISTMLSSLTFVIAYAATPKTSPVFLLQFSFDALLFMGAVQAGFLIGLETAHLGCRYRD